MVIAQQYTHLHHDIMHELSPGSSNGSKEYMKVYQKALTKLMKKMSREDLEAAQETAKRWNMLGPPREIQVRYDGFFKCNWNLNGSY
jgi:hypothetical protein